MPVSFAQIPSNIRVPLYWVEVDPSMAGLPVIKQPALLAGTMIDPGEAEEDVAIPIGTQAQADKWFGQGSELSRMFRSFFRNNWSNEVWGVGIRPPVNATAASGPIEIRVPPREAGTIHLYIGGEYVPVVVGQSDTTEQVADAIVARVNANLDLAVTASRTSVEPITTLDVDDEDEEPEEPEDGNGEDGNGEDGNGEDGNGEDGNGEDGNGEDVVAPPEPPPVPPPVDPDPEPEPEPEPIKLATVWLTCVWAGQTGNDIRVDLNYHGSTGGEQTPIGLGIALPPTGFLTGGAGTLDYTDAIINLGEQQFEYVALPDTESNTLYDWEQEFGFSDGGRWGWARQLFGHVFSARRGTYADLITFGQRRNSGVVSVMAFEVASPTPAFEWSAAYTAKAQRALTNDPARPLQTLALTGVKLASTQERFNFRELNSLAMNGLAIQKPGTDGQPMISREQTTYQLNLYGQTDDAYELVTTLATLARLIRNQRHVVTSKFPRHKLANDGTRFGPGQAIVTPGVIKAELIAQYRQDEFDGLCEDVRNFKRHLICERDPNDQNRVNVLYPPDLVNQLRIFAVLAQFRLQFDRGLDAEVGQAGGGRQASSFAR